MVNKCIKNGFESEQHCREHLPDPDTWVLKIINIHLNNRAILSVSVYKKLYDFECLQYKNVDKTYRTIKYKSVTKYKDVPQYQDVQVKKFNETKYNQDLKNANIAIIDLKDKVSDVLTQIKAINSAKKCNLPLNLTDKVENYAKTECFANFGKHNEIKANFNNLNDEWKYLEYEAQALSQYEPEIIGNNQPVIN